jgi:hypothetical protein
MKPIALLLVVFTCFATPALAWLRPSFEDDEIVARSEAIVVGGIKDGSIRRVDHDRPPGDGRSWEHHATLVVKRVIKGKVEQKEIPLIVHYGLDLVPTDAGAIRLVDTGNSAMGPDLLADARQDHLWLLRRRSGLYGREPGTGDFGIVDPEDVQPVALEDYLKCYLAADPDPAVRAQLQRQPLVAERATHYLQLAAVRRAARIEDAGRRVEALLPYFTSRTSSRAYEEAHKAILSAGPVAGPYLLGVYRATTDSNLRQDVIRAWAKVRWAGCVEELTKLLEQHDGFWANQKLEPGWWNKDADSITTQRRRDVYGEVYAAIHALRQVGDPAARDALEMTRRRWAAIDFDNPQIVEECEAALKQWAAR